MMTSSEVAALPVGSLLYNRKTWGHLVVVENSASEIICLQVGSLYGDLLPASRRLTLEINQVIGSTVSNGGR